MGDLLGGYRRHSAFLLVTQYADTQEKSARSHGIRGQGLRLEFDSGDTLLDAASGTFNTALGYDHPAVVEAVREQALNGVHFSAEFTKKRSHKAIQPLLDVAPPGIDSAWVRDATGSTANECAVRIAQKATGRTEVISLFLSHHGQTFFTAGISGNAFRKAAFPVMPLPIIKVPGPYCHRCFYKQEFPSCDLLCADRITDFLEYASSGSVAAIMVEPVSGNGGNVVPPPGYFERLRDICDRHGILIIADEIQTGIGRLGTVFGSTAVGLRPDIITLSKGLSGIGVPVGAVLMRRDLDVLTSYEHSYTAGANLLGIAAMEATLKVVIDEAFLSDVRRKGALLGERLAQIGARSPIVSDVRGLGLMWGVEISAPDGSPSVRLTNEIINIARSQESLFLRGSRHGFGNVVKVRPALVASDDDLAEIADRLARAIDRAAQG